MKKSANGTRKRACPDGTYQNGHVILGRVPQGWSDRAAAFGESLKTGPYKTQHSFSVHFIHNLLDIRIQRLADPIRNHFSHSGSSGIDYKDLHIAPPLLSIILPLHHTFTKCHLQSVSYTHLTLPTIYSV